MLNTNIWNWEDEVFLCVFDTNIWDILATNAIRLIAMVPACLLGLTLAKLKLNSLIHLIQLLSGNIF